MRGDDGVFVFSIAHVGVCQGVCPLFFEFCEEIQKLFTRAFPPRTPRHPKLKFGEVVEVIILLYYLGCRGGSRVNCSKLFFDMRAWSSDHKKAYDKAWCLETPYLRRYTYKSILCILKNEEIRFVSKLQSMCSNRFPILLSLCFHQPCSL